MPGCDSGHAESTKDGTYNKVGEECAMVLLLQSTSQPLNKEAIYRNRLTQKHITPKQTKQK